MSLARKKKVNTAIPHKDNTQGIKYARVEVLELKQLFDDHDLDLDGKVTPEEMYKSLATHKHFTKQGREAFKVIDLNVDGVLTFDEYLKVCFPLASANERQIMKLWAFPKKEEPLPLSYSLSSDQLNDIRIMFNLYDKDKSGKIERRELIAAARNCGYTEDEAEKLFDSMDQDNNDYITFDEFKELMATSFIGTGDLSL